MACADITLLVRPCDKCETFTFDLTGAQGISVALVREAPPAKSSLLLSWVLVAEHDLVSVQSSRIRLVGATLPMTRSQNPKLSPSCSACCY